MIKDFFVWLITEGQLSCAALQAVFGGNDGVANTMMAQLAWFDPSLQTGPIGELFVVNRGLNHLKGAVSLSVPVYSNVAVLISRSTVYEWETTWGG
jgi:hypothetical protein